MLLDLVKEGIADFLWILLLLLIKKGILHFLWTLCLLVKQSTGVEVAVCDAQFFAVGVGELTKGRFDAAGTSARLQQVVTWAGRWRTEHSPMSLYEYTHMNLYVHTHNNNNNKTLFI